MTRNILMKLHAHLCTIVIYILYNFEETPFFVYLVMAEDRQCQTSTPPPSAGDNETVLLRHLLFTVHYVTHISRELWSLFGHITTSLLVLHQCFSSSQSLMKHKSDKYISHHLCSTCGMTYKAKHMLKRHAAMGVFYTHPQK